MRRITLRRVGIIGAVVLPITAAGLGIAKPATAASRHALAGTVPTWATSQHRVATSSAATASTSASAVAGRVWMQYNHQDQVKALLAKVTSADSRAHGQYLTATQFNARFSPTNTQVGAVKSWLNASGLTSTVGAGNRYVDFTGPASKVAAAFGTTFASYRYRGKVYRAPTKDASVPVALTSAVLTVTGLDNYQPPKRTRVQPPEPPVAGFRNAPACSAYYRQQTANSELDGTALPTFRGSHPSWIQCGMTPAQLRGAYGITDRTPSGAGITVADVLWYHSGTLVSDVNRYFANHFPSARKLVLGKNYLETNAPKATHTQLCGNAADEETLDIEAVHAIAPGARIQYFGAQSCLDSDLIDTLQSAVDANVDVITNSWGDIIQNESSAGIQAFEQIFSQAAIQGITVLFSSGDDGDSSDLTSDGSKDAGYPDADPLVTAAGGTSIGVDKNNHIAFQSGWGTERWGLTQDATGALKWQDTGFLYGSGGGVSPFAKPSWQQGFGSDSKHRLVPDLSTDGDVSTGMLIGLTQDFGAIGGGVEYGEYRIGGTSLSAPLEAAMIAIADQIAHASGKQHIGFANPAIYQLAAAHSASIQDVVHHDGAFVRNDFVNGVNNNDGYTYSVRTVDQDTSLKTTPGYDLVTGVGTPTGSFYAAIAALAPAS